MATQTQQQTANTAQLGIPVPLAYGFVHATGNLVAKVVASDGTATVLYLLGDGEWDGIERLYVNRVPFDLAQAHFHPGTDGGATSQQGDALNQTLNLDPGLTFSRTAYIALTVPPDPGAPNADVEVIGNYRALKVRTFDAVGNQTGYVFSTNPAWQTLDVIIRCWLKRHSLINAPLTAAERKRFDWGSFYDTAQYNDEVLSSGQKRFESSVAFVNKQNAQNALEQLLLVGRSFLREVAGVIQLRSDKPRGSSFVLTSAHVDLNTLSQADRSSMVGAANQFTGNFLDVDGALADIAPPSTQGLVRHNNIVTCLCMSAPAVSIGEKIGVKRAVNPSFNIQDAVVTARTNLNTVQWAQAGPEETSGGGVLTSEALHFSACAPVLKHETNQKANGMFGPGIPSVPREIGLDLDYGNNTVERVRRLLYFQKTRLLGVDQSPYVGPWNFNIDAFYDAIDKKGNMLAQLRPGDLLTVDRSISEEMQGDYEIIEFGPQFDGLNNSVHEPNSAPIDSSSAKPDTIKLSLLQTVPEAYVDVLPEDQDDIELPPPGVLATQFQPPHQFAVDTSGGPAPWLDLYGYPLTTGVFVDGVGSSRYSVPNVLPPFDGDIFNGHYRQGDSESQWLHLFDFQFLVPATAVIKGIELQLHRSSSSNIDSWVFDDGIFLLVGGARSGTDHSSGQWPFVPNSTGRNPDGSVSDEDVRYGTNTDTWGLTLIGGQVSVVNFGIAIRLKVRCASKPPVAVIVTAPTVVNQMGLRVFYQ